MIRPLLSLEHFSFDEKQGQVCYRRGKDAKEVERMNYLEFIAWTTSHIPDKGQVTIRYFGLYANAHRGKVKKASLVPVALGMIEEELRPIPFRRLRLNLTNAKSLIYHPQRWDEAKSVP
jgi:hypothetical protein